MAYLNKNKILNKVSKGDFLNCICRDTPSLQMLGITDESHSRDYLPWYYDLKGAHKLYIQACIAKAGVSW